MSNKKNYNKMSAKPEVEEVVAEASTPEVTEQPTPKKPEFKEGVVANCSSLNVRKKPTIKAGIVKVINKGAIVKVNLDKSTDDFYALPDGFCMKQYITLK